MDQTIKPHTPQESNYDLLRVICTLAIIIIHVSAICINSNSYTDSYNNFDITAVFCITMSRFAVPCFLFLSGAFLLDNDKNQNYSTFYRKKLIKIFIPTIIFTIIYFLYYITITTIGVANGTAGLSAYLTPIKNLLKGAPTYHMWYMYTLIGIYLLIPVMIKLKLDIGEKAFARLSWIYFLVSIASGLTTTSLLCWGLPSTVMYLGYVLIGYQIRKNTKEKKNNAKGILFIILGLLSLLLLSFLYYLVKVGTIKNIDEELFSNNFNPLIAIAGMFVFLGFSYIRINSIKIISFVSRESFVIYLIHVGVISIIFRNTGYIGHSELFIPIGTSIVFLISLILAIGYNKLWVKLDKEERISGKICKLLHL